MELLLAKIVATFHGTFVVFLIVGVILALFGILKKYRTIEVLLLIGIAITIFSFLIFKGCFLTTIEQQLRISAGAESYESGFISHYLGKLGINVSDVSVFRFLVILMAIGILSEVYWNRKEIRRFFDRIKF